MDLIEAEGLQAVSMTRLATELGCGLIPLYTHVPSTSALLDGIAATILAGLDAGPVTAGVGWADQMRTQARAIRQAGRAHPRCSVAVAGREPTTDAMLRPAEHALATLGTAGFGGKDAVGIVRALAAYLVGSLLRESGGVPGLGGSFDSDDRRPRLRPSEFPQITRLAAELATADPDADFELGLDLLVRGMGALLAVRRGG